MDADADWPIDRLNALRLGRRLVAEVASSGPGRRAFVDIQPEHKPADSTAKTEGWSRPDPSRSYVVEHWEYAEDRLDGFDYDEGAERIAVLRAANETDLRAAITTLGLGPSSFKYPWDTDDPR